MLIKMAAARVISVTIYSSTVPFSRWISEARAGCVSRGIEATAMIAYRPLPILNTTESVG